MFEDLSGRLTDATMKRWEEEEQEALEEGGDALAVYGVRQAEGQWAIQLNKQLVAERLIPAPSLVRRPQWSVDRCHNERWEEEEQEALEEGGDALAVYGVRQAEGQWAIAIKYAIGC